MEKINVIIVDDHKIFRDGMKLMFSKLEYVELIPEASNGKEFLELIDSYDVDLVFMDINMPLLDGFEAVKAGLEKQPNLKIIALTTYDEDEHFSKMIRAGVDGYMLKNSSIDDFIKAIDVVVNGGNYFSNGLVEKLTKNLFKNKKQDEKTALLSSREKEVLQLICKGYTNEKIGDELNISSRTVERHKSNLILKTDTINTLNLVIYSFKNKLVEMN